jgi:predicted anti-sigma-YlaC factor YlaD
MNTCDEILIQKWALIDGEKPDLSAAEIDAHLDGCESCSREIAEMQSALFRLEAASRRRTPRADLWSAVEKRIAAKFLPDWQPFAWLAVLLAVFRLLEMLSARDLGWVIKFVPLVLVAALFGFLKENPFKINTELIPEK